MLFEDTNEYAAVFKIELMGLTLVSRLVIWWLGVMKPWYVSIDYTLDDFNWQKYLPYKLTLPPLKQPWLLFTEIVDFTPKQYLKGIKILMKRQMIPNFRLGILRAHIFSQEQTVILKPKGNNNKCLARADNDFGKLGAELVVMDCADASIINDGREIFVLTTDQQIRSHGDEFCVFPIGEEIKLVVCLPFVTT